MNFTDSPYEKMMKEIPRPIGGGSLQDLPATVSAVRGGAGNGFGRCGKSRPMLGVRPTRSDRCGGSLPVTSGGRSGDW